MERSSWPQDYGYEDARFENAVSPNFHCPICLNVLKDPKMCKNNEHVFCTPCIARHLVNSSSCPQCKERLTLGTVTRPPRVLVNCLSELKINCDYFSRGCLEFVQLGDLRIHVVNCEFAPVRCSNDGCAMQINRRDRVRHETEVCEFRKVNCHDCGEIRKQIHAMKLEQAEMKHPLSYVELNLKAVKEDISSLNDDMKDVRHMLNSVVNRFNNVEIPPLHLKSTNKQDIIVAGTYDSYTIYCSSVEIFRWDKGTWTSLPAMKEPRAGATSFIYGNQIIVSGGSSSDSMEMLRTDQELLQWVKFPAKLPAKISDHKTVVHQNRLIVIGGHNGIAREFSDAIYEVLLLPPYSTKFLGTIPQPRTYHGAELFDDKILILGGRTSTLTEGISDSVIVYDISKNECKQMAPLPYAVSGMATVRWRNKVILIGGKNRNNQILNDVIMYDIETEERNLMPSMKYKRLGCSAVLAADVIVVMGGWNEEHKHLNSVECFSFSSKSWQDLPPMIKPRQWTTAVVKSINFN